jgi:hypothetical protein
MSHGLRPFDELRAHCGLYSVGASRLNRLCWRFAVGFGSGDAVAFVLLAGFRGRGRPRHIAQIRMGMTM